MKYYKISPEWAKKLNVMNVAVKHPDGWYLVLPPYVMPLLEILEKEEKGPFESIEDAVRSIGGCIYTKEEALASQRGEAEYMMNKEEEE